ncbi:hypothetical protein [Rubrolithibacter danxiaensis]|uniref:hypothetical protein n=1 Tax=Rubrolithibacter danxiaensis TaxID=3390805 RepID=UPI003BF7EDAD
MTFVSHYPGFEYSIEQLYKFIAVHELFTIMLNDGRIIHFTPNDPDSFRQWLQKHQIQDIRREDGWVIS